MSHYRVLGVARHADGEAIRRAFRALARRFHPDAGEGSSAARFRELVDAYETLNDPVRRQRYDRMLDRVQRTPAPPPVIEPLHPRTREGVEPLSNHATHGIFRSSPFRPRAVNIEDVVDELFSTWDDFFF